MYESKEWRPKNLREKKKTPKDEQMKEVGAGGNIQLLNSKILGVAHTHTSSSHIHNYTHFGSSAFK